MRHLVFLLLLIFNSTIQAQERTFSAFIVQDIDKSIEWYQSVLEVQLKDSVSIKDRGLKMANLLNDYWQIELIELVNTTKPTDNQPIIGIFKVGRTIDDLDKKYAHFHNLKVNFRGNVFTDKISGLRSFIILDPDGNRIQFFGQ